MSTLVSSGPLRVKGKFMMVLSCRHEIPFYGNPFKLLELEELKDIMSRLNIDEGYVGYYCSVCHKNTKVLRFDGSIDISGNPLL